MIKDILIITGIIVLILGFLAEYVNSTLGMGYGTTLTPILLLIGFGPLKIVPAILFSQFLCGILAAYLHNMVGNVSFDFRRDKESIIVKRLGVLGYIPKSKDSKVAFVFALCGIFGVIVAVLVAINISSFYLKIYIGMLVLSMGIIILFKRNKKHSFSWKKLFGFGLLASFNKGISGGGYGPIVVSGQVLTGVKAKSAIAITSFSESLTCLVGVVAYSIASTSALGFLEWDLALFLIVGSLLSVPFSVITVKKMKSKNLTYIIGIATLCLGVFTLTKFMI